MPQPRHGVRQGRRGRCDPALHGLVDHVAELVLGLGEVVPRVHGGDGAAGAAQAGVVLVERSGELTETFHGSRGDVAAVGVVVSCASFCVFFDEDIEHGSCERIARVEILHKVLVSHMPPKDIGLVINSRPSQSANHEGRYFGLQLIIGVVGRPMIEATQGL